jgi:hypothetical protein
MEQIAGIRLVEASEGRARGCRLLDVWTGSGLRFQANADRALDLSYCEFQGLPLAWRSPAGDVHPSYYEPEGLGWLRSFAGGLLTTCGLDQFGSMHDAWLPWMDAARLSYVRTNYILPEVRFAVNWFGAQAGNRKSVLLAENARPSRNQPIRPLVEIGMGVATGDSGLVRGTPCRHAVHLGDIQASQ